jgi:LysR family hydrogen peroxide-inducible transcriptional activator
MEMHQLRYFAAVARTGTFSRGAQEYRVAQPSLSQQILKLEEELGDRLFERTQRRALLTTAGSLFLPYAKSILVGRRARTAGDLRDGASKSEERSFSERFRPLPHIFCLSSSLLSEKNIPRSK